MLSQEEMDKAYSELRKAELMKSLNGRNHFDVIPVRQFVESIGGSSYEHQDQPFYKWHCVHYSDMPKGVKETLFQQVNDYIVEQQAIMEARSKNKSRFKFW